ncbi:hypothetical protein M8J76_007341 [Diaphorina citri]|nr:hypothetical protein M8J75_002101 [Diaphorina citri]KAI5745006.1 hypothetical protein M8J76_007341 [Diaphorina citri]
MSLSTRFLLLFVFSIISSTTAVRPIIEVSSNGRNISITSVAQPLPAELNTIMCRMPSLPPGAHICRQAPGSQNPELNLDSIWAEICQSVALILGYAKGTCLSVESPPGSNRMYSACALNADVSQDATDGECAVYLTTERLAVPIPRNQKCASNGYKVMYEKV